MKILGVDPGTTRIGYGIIEKRKGSLASRAHNYLNLEKTSEHERLSKLSRLFEDVLITYRPDIVAFERVFFSKNRKTALAVSEARGVLKSIAAAHNIPIREYTPTQVKVAVSGDGGADKKAVQKMTAVLLGLTSIPKPDDVADALAVAVCAASYAWKEYIDNQ
jgi:crossover junction endodeoxyribonuclease RuvC